MRLHRSEHSSHARYVQAAIALAGVPCEVAEVPFGERDALASRVEGPDEVPVLELDDRAALRGTRRILETLLRDDARFSPLVPEADAAPVWAYADWASTTLEDVAFRLATPGLAARLGPGFVGRPELGGATRSGLESTLESMLEPTRRTLAQRHFLFGRAPTLADAALYGSIVMLDFGAPDRVAELGDAILRWRARLEKRLGPPPFGRVAARHRPLEDMEARLAAAPEPTGKLELIVVRPLQHERLCPETVELDPDEGVRGDRWQRDDGDRARQVAIMDVRVAESIAAREDWPLFGDNLFVSFHLGASSLRPGDRLRLGGAVLEITDEPHNGCRKLAARFGPRVIRFVNHRDHLAERRRGIYARVVERGTVSIGDPVERL